jgi:hypothetical protein
MLTAKQEAWNDHKLAVRAERRLPRGVKRSGRCRRGCDCKAAAK